MAYIDIITDQNFIFVRYADDALIFCKGRKSAERTLASIIPFIEGELFLKVNQAKTTVTHVCRIKYLGYAFYRNKGKCRFRVHPKNVQKMKDRIREITQKNKAKRIKGGVMTTGDRNWRSMSEGG